jgi:hypothetical protein
VTLGAVIVTWLAHRYGTQGTTLVIMYLSKPIQQLSREEPDSASHRLIRPSTLGTPPAG